VINLSLGGPNYSAALCGAVEAAVKADVVVVASSGNDGMNGLNYPAGCLGSIAVGSVDQNDVVAPSSTGIISGDDFLIMAPGVNVTSTLPTSGVWFSDPTGYGRMSGTSMAAPHVSGLVALLRGLRPSLSVAEVKQLLRDSADRVGGPYSLWGTNCQCSTSPRYGMGRINVRRAFDALFTRYRYMPVVQSMTPGSGPVGVPSMITITGQYFANVQDVSFSDGQTTASATSFNVSSAAELTALTPVWTHGAITHVTVRTQSGPSTAATPDADRFTYAPRITKVTPLSGPVTGGTTVNIEGEGFVPGTTGTTVNFGSAVGVNPQCSDDKHCVVASPRVLNAGVVGLKVVAGGVESDPVSYEYLGPTISRVDPAIGPAIGGTTVHLYGLAFDPAMKVYFDNDESRNGYVSCDDTTRCTVRSPGGRGKVHIWVRANGLESSRTDENAAFVYADFPSVSAVVPAIGPATGETPVTIVGTNFSTQPGATQFSFGPNAAKNISCASSTRCTASSPGGLLSVDVTATVNNLRSEPNPGDKFGYVPVITSISPSSGPQSGGTSVTINGVGFADYRQWFTASNVSFGTAAAKSFTCLSSTTCSAVSPTGSGVVDVHVTADILTSDPVSADQFTYVALTNAGWTPWANTTPSSARGNLAYDTRRNVVLYVGGGGLTGPTETWTFSGGSSSWTQLAPAISPDTRNAGSLAFDEAHGTAVLLGGTLRRRVGSSTMSFDEGATWLWDGTNWSTPMLSVAPPARHGASMAYDAAHGRVVLFGGCANAQCTTRLNDTWTWDGATWTQLAPVSSPSARAQAGLAYDATHGTLVLFGGEDANGSVLGDTWIWNGMNWLPQSPSLSPAPRQSAGLAFHPATGGVLLFGGITATDYATDTWTWNGTTWSQQWPSTSPTGGGMVYDALHKLVVLLEFGTTWTWSGN